MNDIIEQKIINKIKGFCLKLDIDNIDTDMIIPKQFLKTITRIGLGKFLFYEQRYNEEGSLKPEHPFNFYPGNKSNVLLAGKNFGCGSSREHAPWAIRDFGIKVIIAESFADIFYNNCFENQILPITLKREEILKLMDLQKTLIPIEIDIDNQIVLAGDFSAKFEIEPAKKRKITHNLDTIGETLEMLGKIEKFEKNYRLL